MAKNKKSREPTPLTNFFGGSRHTRARQNESGRQARAIPFYYAPLPTVFVKRTCVDAASCVPT